MSVNSTARPPKTDTDTNDAACSLATDRPNGRKATRTVVIMKLNDDDGGGDNEPWTTYSGKPCCERANLSVTTVT